MSFDESDDKQTNPLAWFGKRDNQGYAAGWAVGLALCYAFDIYLAGYPIIGWVFAGLGRQLATLDEFWMPDEDPIDTQPSPPDQSPTKRTDKA